jgi:hypothetical protein
VRLHASIRQRDAPHHDAGIQASVISFRCLLRTQTEPCAYTSSRTCAGAAFGILRPADLIGAAS